MKGAKYVLVGVVLIILLLSSTSSLGIAIASNKKSSSTGAVLEVTTDKIIYSPGEPVAIFLTNVGDELLSAGGPIITIYNNDNEIVYQEATYCWYELEPGEYVTWPPWDQTDQQGVQVPVGRYVVEGFLSGGEENYIDTATFYIFNGPWLKAKRTVIP